MCSVYSCFSLVGHFRLSFILFDFSKGCFFRPFLAFPYVFCQIASSGAQGAQETPFPRAESPLLLVGSWIFFFFFFPAGVLTPRSPLFFWSLECVGVPRSLSCGSSPAALCLLGQLLRLFLARFSHVFFCCDSDSSPVKGHLTS